MREGFRPLDGESISKHTMISQMSLRQSFRPLDGESISKLENDLFIENIEVSVP